MRSRDAEPAPADEVLAAAADFIDRHRLIAPGESVVVGLSGGADSVALLAILCELAEQPQRAYRLAAAHLDHALRADSADDATFAAELAGQWGVPCLVERRDVAAAAKAEGLGIEAAARQLRYEFLAEAARHFGASVVTVAHHADDNVETVLHHVLRGSGLRGLAGIPPRRPLGDGRTVLVRPLLEIRRADLEACCRRRGLAWRTDETNADSSYARNFLRNELLPLLRQRVNPQVDQALLRLAAAAGQAEMLLAEMGRRALEATCAAQRPRAVVLRAAGLANEPAVVRRYALRAALERLNAPMGRLTAERLTELANLAALAPPAAVPLPGGLMARRQAANLIIERPLPPPAGRQAPVALAVPGCTELADGWTVHCRLEPFDARCFQDHCVGHPPGAELLDAERVRGRLLCRPRRAGDAFVPLGASGRQTVSDFLTNLKLPRHLRRLVRCIADEEGIVYLAPLRIAERVRVRPETRTVLRLEARPPAAWEGLGGPPATGVGGARPAAT